MVLLLLVWEHTWRNPELNRISNGHLWSPTSLSPLLHPHCIPQRQLLSLGRCLLDCVSSSLPLSFLPLLQVLSHIYIHLNINLVFLVSELCSLLKLVLAFSTQPYVSKIHLLLSVAVGHFLFSA